MQEVAEALAADDLANGIIKRSQFAAAVEQYVKWLEYKQYVLGR